MFTSLKPDSNLFTYNPALLTLVETNPRSIEGVLQVMQAIDATCINADGLKWFNWLYLQVTQAVEKQVSAGGFSDLAWLAELDVQFAAFYFSALKSWLSGEATPGCWRVLFESRDQRAIARIQFAIAGINAHINHDLPEAIVATCAVKGTPPSHDSANYRDYTSVNATLNTLVDTAKAELNFRLPGDSMPPLSTLDQRFEAWSVSAARESAWQNAECLWQLRTSSLLTDTFLDTLDGLTTVIGKTLLVPVP